jgi:hypothetical protein
LVLDTELVKPVLIIRQSSLRTQAL